MTTDFSRRRFLQAGLAAAVVAPLLSACNLDPAAKSAKESVRFSSYGDPTKLGLRSKLADQYTSSHPEVKMVFEGTATAEYWDKLATQMAGGNAPDVINIDIARIGQYGAAGALQSLQKYIPDAIDAKSFDKNLLSQGQLKGEQFGIPVAMGAYSMGYDVTVLDQLGLEHPKETWTWSDYAALANEVRQKSGKKVYGSEDPSGDSTSLQIFLRGKGEELYKDGTIAFTEDTLTEWFEYWAALRATGGTIPADIAAQAVYGDWPTLPLVKKQAALGHIHTPNLKGGFQDLTDHTIDITLPPRYTQGGKCATFPAPSSYLSLNAKSKRADDAAAFINWFTNGEEAAKTLRLISGPPASSAGRDVLLKGSDLSASEKQVLAYTDLALKNAFAPPQASPAASTAVSDLLLKTSQDIAFQKISIKQGVPKFVADARKTLDGK